MHIHWFVPAEIKHPKDINTINLASIRLRAGAVMQALEGLRHAISFGEFLPKSTDVCIIGKIGGADTLNKQFLWLQQLRVFKGKIILDFTDDHLSHNTIMTAFFLECLKIVDCVICSSNYLKIIVSQYYLGRIEVIPDAIEYEIRPPKNIYNSPVRLMWFGHATNMEALIEFVPKIRSTVSISLTVISNQPGLQIFKSSKLHCDNLLEINMHVWSIEVTKLESKNCDICIIPVKLTENRKAGASSNRLLTALALGMPTCADIIDSYSPYNQYFGDLRSSEFNEMLTDPVIWNSRIQSAQKNILPDYTVASLGGKWISLLESYFLI